MSTQKSQKVNFDGIVERFMAINNLEHEFQVAELLGFSRTAFSQRKKRESAPIDKIAIWCEQNGVNINWIISGEGEQSSQEAHSHQTQNELFPKEYDPGLMMKVTTAINDIVMKRGCTVPVDKLSTVTSLAYADAYWRRKNVNTEYLEYLIGVSSLDEGGLTKERVFLEAMGGYLIAEQLPQVKGWLEGIKIIEISVERKDDIDGLANKIFKQLGTIPTRGAAQRGRQLTDKFIEIYQEYRHLIIVINDAHLLSDTTLKKLKSFRERTDRYKMVPGIILLGPLNTLKSAVAGIDEIAQRCLQINEHGQLAGLNLPLGDYMKRK
jgi:hypothetical protein